MIIYQLNQRLVSDPVYNGAALRRLRSCSTAPPEGYAEAGRARLCVALPGKSGELLLNTRCNPRLPIQRRNFPSPACLALKCSLCWGKAPLVP